MQTSTVQPIDAPASRAPTLAGWSDFLIGLLLTSLVPAIFWVTTFAAAAGMAGYSLEPASLLMAGAAIAAFLGTFFAILTARSQ